MYAHIPDVQSETFYNYIKKKTYLEPNGSNAFQKATTFQQKQQQKKLKKATNSKQLEEQFHMTGQKKRAF